MVALERSRRGASTMGCLLSLVLFVAALYYGVHIGEVYLRYYRLLDAMRFQAHLAPNIKDDTVIASRLTAAADSIVGRPLRFKIARTTRRITIQTEYSDLVDLPLLKLTFPFQPRAEAPL